MGLVVTMGKSLVNLLFLGIRGVLEVPVLNTGVIEIHTSWIELHRRVTC